MRLMPEPVCGSPCYQDGTEMRKIYESRLQKDMGGVYPFCYCLWYNSSGFHLYGSY